MVYKAKPPKVSPRAAKAIHEWQVVGRRLHPQTKELVGTIWQCTFCGLLHTQSVACPKAAPPNDECPNRRKPYWPNAGKGKKKVPKMPGRGPSRGGKKRKKA
jgi:hypothetical protein